ncbi:MAG: 30S ribosomal protein S8 [Patescibacteria group bacterium]
MVITDPIADMLVRIRNAGSAGKAVAYVPYSDLKLRIAHVLMKEGYISSVTRKTLKGKTTGRMIELGIKYDLSVQTGGSRQPRVRGAERVSRASRRLYVGARDIHPIYQGHGVMLLSTPKGILTGDDARREHVGGEIICKVW